MEMGNKKIQKLLNTVWVIGLFVSIISFQFWLEPLSDYPFKDEYQSILSALGIPVYTTNLHVLMLTFFTTWFPDFFSLSRFNFMASHLLLAASFFAFHWRKGVSLATNIFFTSALSLSTINIALTRKMHFWAAAFFFLILFLADFLEEKKRRIFLFVSLFILGFFRVEFLFSAAVAAAFLAGEYFSGRFERRKLIAVIVVAGSVLAFLTITTFGHGMKELLIESFKIQGRSPDILELALQWIELFLRNAGLHAYYSALSFFTTLQVYFSSFGIAFAALIYFSDDLKRGLFKAKDIFLKEYLPFYCPAIIALFSVRFMDFYIIMTFVLMLSLFSFFLMNVRKPAVSVPLMAFLVLPAFFIQRPELKGSAYINFPTHKRAERIHRQVFDIIGELKVNPGDAPYKILFNQHVSGILPFDGRLYYMNSDLPRICKQGPVVFDIVLLTGKWFSDPYQKTIESCVLPGLSGARHLKPAPGYDLYLGPRVTFKKSLEKMPF